MGDGSDRAGVLRKGFDAEALLRRMPEVDRVETWRALCPELAVSDEPLAGADDGYVDPSVLAEQRAQLIEEGYFQTGPMLPARMCEDMLRAIERVREAGYPPMFALVYDVFYAAFARCSPVLAGILGPGYRIIPNFWVYYIAPSDEAKGFEPHRDAEYADTLDAAGMPSVITCWISITEATPINSCMYILPKSRDPQYAAAVHDLKTRWDGFALEDLRALPTQAGTLSCWDQYVLHFGSRASRRAPGPRVSLAAYCQRGDVAAVDDRLIEVPSRLDFRARLGFICRGLRRYSYVTFQDSPHAAEILEFLNRHADH